MATDALTDLTAAIAQGLGATTGSMRPAIEQLFGDRYQKRYLDPTSIRDAYGLAGDRVPLRDPAVPRTGVHVPARAHARGRVRQSARRAAARPARPDCRGDRGTVRRPARRAHRTAGPPCPSRRGLGQGPGLSPA